MFSLLFGLFYNSNEKNTVEGLITLNSDYMTIYPKPQDSNSNYYLQEGYYDLGNNKMALCPNGYIITNDFTGVITNITTEFINIKQDKNGNYTIPQGYYSISQNSYAGPNMMAIIPYGFIVNSSKTGIMLDPALNNINSPIAQKSPTSNLGDANYNSSIQYDSNNFNLQYHDDISMNSDLIGLQENTVYYQPGAFKYGASSYVPNYEDSVYLSKTTYLPTTSVYNNGINPNDICNLYSNYPERLENACNNLDNGTCRRLSPCCVLLGGSKCVSGNQQGAKMSYNYSDYLIKNRDYYYYLGNCYGNCPQYDVKNNK
jgi:hypothetical protein